VAPTSSRVARGKQGERLARRELERRGYVILATRYRSRYGEIDIVCDDGGTIVFVEVKARRSARLGSAAEAIPGWKRRRIGAMALDYLAWTNRLGHACRFDVVAVDGLGTDDQVIKVVADAFQLDGK
jgi:putative endonuclease